MNPIVANKLFGTLWGSSVPYLIKLYMVYPIFPKHGQKLLRVLIFVYGAPFDLVAHIAIGVSFSLMLTDIV